MRVLITGIAGFAGSHLVDHLLQERDIEIGGVLRPLESLRNIAQHADRLSLATGELLDCDFVDGWISDFQPDCVIHLAAQSIPALSWQSPAETLTNNIVSQVNILESLRRSRPGTRVLVIGSGDEYGVVQQSELPIRESNPLRPNNPYSVSKIAQDMLGYQYFLGYGMPIVRVRPFNHTGPRQGDSFVVSSFARQVASAELGLTAGVISVGNLDARRDFTDGRDVVRAYWLAAKCGVPGEVYNIGSGRSRQIGEVLDLILSMAKVKMSVEVDPARLRPSDVPEVVCDFTKIKNLTGWEPAIPLEKTVGDLLQYWREALAAQTGSAT